MPHNLREFVYPAPRTGLRERLLAIEVTDDDALVEVLYVQPEATEGVRGIDFSQFAAYVARHDDPLSRTFASHLLKWRAVAGSSEPIDVSALVASLPAE